MGKNRACMESVSLCEMGEALVKIEDVLESKGRVKILKLLAAEGELNVSEISRRTGLNNGATRKHLRFLMNRAQLVMEKRFGRIRIYRFRVESLRARALKNLFEIWENSSL